MGSAVAELRLAGGLVCAVLLIAATFVASYRVAWLLAGHGAFVLRLAGTMVIGCWSATIGFHLLRIFGLFNPITGVIIALLMATVSMRALRGTSTRVLLRRDARVVRKLASGLRRSPWFPALLFFVPFIVLRITRAMFQPALSWDTLTYHGPRAIMFVQSGAFTFEPAPGTWSVFRNVFAGGEVLWAWAMLPFHNDVLASFTNAVQWLGVGLATWAFGRSLRLREPYAFLAGVLVLFIPTLQLEIPSGYVEPPLYLAFMVSLAAAVDMLRRPQASRFVLGMMAAGLAIGIKQLTAPPLALVCLFMLWRMLGSPRVQGWRLAMGLGLVAVILPPLPWIVHAWIDTGAPFSPVPFRIFGLTLGEAAPHFAWHIQQDVSAAYTLKGEWAALKAIFAAPGFAQEAMGLFSLIPIVLIPAGLRRLFRSSRSAGWLVLVVSIVMWASLYFPGLSVARMLQPANMSRYVMGVVLVGLPLSLFGVAVWPRVVKVLAGVLWCCFAYNAISYALRGWAQFEPTLICSGLAGGAVWGSILLSLMRKPTAVRLFAGLAVTWLALVGLRHGQLAFRYEAARQSEQLHWILRYWADGAEAIDNPGTSHEVAVTAGPTQVAGYWFTYFFFGSELQNRMHYVPVTTDGQIAHFGPNDMRRRLADRDAWLHRLDERGITHVVTFKPNSVERDWIRQLPGQFEQLQGAEDWGVFRIRGK
jgi:hypothetical protein